MLFFASQIRSMHPLAKTRQFLERTVLGGERQAQRTIARREIFFSVMSDDWYE